MRPIDADALKESLQQSYCKLVEIYQKHQDGKTKAQLIAFKEAILRTNDQPTLDVEPVRHGRWETDREDIEWGNSLKRKHCTNCGSRPHFDKEKREFVLTNYCPNCGAKMDAKENDDA